MDTNTIYIIYVQTHITEIYIIIILKINLTPRLHQCCQQHHAVFQCHLYSICNIL